MKSKTRVKVIVQGANESGADYEKRLNEYLNKGSLNSEIALVCPSASSTGRMTSIINYITINQK